MRGHCLGKLTYHRVQGRGEFKSGIVTFGESKIQHFKSLKNREWFLGDAKVEELSEYKNLGVLKNYVSSLPSNIDDNIDKTRKKLV